MKRLVSSLLALSMLCGMSAQVFADTPSGNTDKILASVKNRITIPLVYDSFISDSYTDERGTEYTFSWEADNKSIEVAANENGIISSCIYTDSTDADNPKPQINKASQDDLYKAACDYVKQLNPDIYNSLKINGITNTESITNDSYYFDIQRYENNIPVSGDGGYVAVSSDGKTLKDFFLTYTTDVEFKKPNKIISRDAAQRAYTDKIGFSLCYGSNYVGNKITAFPIYTTNDESMKYISAVNGNPIKLNDVSYVYQSSAEEKQGAFPYPEARDEYTEANELKGISDILSERKAVEIARGNEIINIPKYYKLRSVCGFKDSDNENKCFYTLLFVGAKNSDYVEVMLDAKSREIVNFNRTQNDGKKVITNEKAKKIAQKALAVLAPSHTNDYVLNYAGENGVFSFVRKVNGIEFPANQINIFVDMTNGNVVWYDFSYSDIRFPSLEKVIPSDKIAKFFFENSDFGPAYVLNCSKPGMTKYDRATLVYKFSDSDVTEFDAITGKPMRDNSDK